MWLVAIRPSGRLIMQCPNASENRIQNDYTFIYLHTYIQACHSFRVDSINSPTSTTDVQQPRDTVVHHTPWLRPLRPFLQAPANGASATASPLRGSNYRPGLFYSTKKPEDQPWLAHSRRFLCTDVVPFRLAVGSP